MPVDIKTAVVKNMDELKKAISEKSSEVAQLEEELKRHETVLALLSDHGAQRGRNGTGRRRGRADLRAVLTRLPDTFTSRDFVRAGSRTRKPPIYLRQILSRWVKQGKIKRLERGKYQKTKKANLHRLAA